MQKSDAKAMKVFHQIRNVYDTEATGDRPTRFPAPFCFIQYANAKGFDKSLQQNFNYFVGEHSKVSQVFRAKVTRQFSFYKLRECRLAKWGYPLCRYEDILNTND